MKQKQNTQYLKKNKLTDNSFNTAREKKFFILGLIFLCLLLITMQTSACEDNVQTMQPSFSTNNNTSYEEIISITPLWICEKQNLSEEEGYENITTAELDSDFLFKVKRENYSQLGGEKIIQYNIIVNFTNTSTATQNVSKTIRSYSSTNTGDKPCKNFSEIEKIVIKSASTQIAWSINNNKNTSTQVTTNQTTNSSINTTTTPTLNESENTSNNTLSNTTNQTSTNTSTNTSVNQTSDSTNESIINNTNSNTQTNQSADSHKGMCIIKTEKNIFKDGEKVSFWFDNPHQTIDSITYWIEDIQGTNLKKEFTSANSNEKSFTWNLKKEQQIAHIYARCCFQTQNCVNNKSMIVAYKEKISSGEENETDEDEQNTLQDQTTTTQEEESNSISFYKTVLKEKNKELLLQTQIRIKKISGRSQLTTCEIKTQENTSASKDIILVAKTKGTFEARLQIPLLSMSKTYTLGCQGLKTSNQTTIINEYFINETPVKKEKTSTTSNKQQSLQSEENDKKLTAKTTTNEEKILEKITGMSYVNPDVKNEEKVFIYSGLGAILVLFLWFLFKYDLKRNNSFIKQVSLKLKSMLKNR
ncbi:MAG: hypothetical protein ACLFNM_00405 [Candidatus Woesearchaeota archaeon]